LLHFTPNLAANLDDADDTYNRINASIDSFIAKSAIDAPPGGVYEPVWQPPHERATLALEGSGIAAIIWCIGFTPDFSWIDAPVFNGRGYPAHTRGVTPVGGLYFVGLPWLHTWGSGRFSGIARDADHIVQAILARQRERAAACASMAA
jgi:putative flavoprotein involved in K+ transport